MLMVEDRLELFNSLNKYYKSLSSLGYICPKETRKLLMLSFIDDVLNGMFGYIITEDEYKLLINVLGNMYGTSCIIQYPEYLKRVMELKHENPLVLTPSVISRVSEQNTIRYTQSDNLRIVE